MRDIAAHLRERHRRECRAIGRNAQEGQVAYREGCVQTPQKRSDVVMGGIVVSDVIEDPLVAAIIDRGENTEGAIIEFIGSHIPVWSKNSCGGARVVFQKPTEPFMTLDWTLTRHVLAERRQEQDIALTLMIPLVMIMSAIRREGVP